MELTILYLLPVFGAAIWWLLFKDWFSVYLLALMAWASYSAFTTGAAPVILQDNVNATILIVVTLVLLFIPNKRKKK